MTKRPTNPAAAKSEQPSQPKQAPTLAPITGEPKQSSPSKPKPASKGMPVPKNASKAKTGASAQSKQDRVVAMLQRKEGQQRRPHRTAAAHRRAARRFDL